VRYKTRKVRALCGGTVRDAVGREEFGDSGGAAPVPDFVEPSFREGDISFGHDASYVPGVDGMVPPRAVYEEFYFDFESSNLVGAELCCAPPTL
jgi:hypothetical protein